LGGLDSRYAATILKAKQIASITTLGTPHWGSPVADWAVDQIHGNSLWYRFFRLLGYDMKNRHFLPELTTAFLKNVFNPKVPNLPGVRYFSVVSHASFADGTMSYLLWFPERWMREENSPLLAHGDDGLVPTDSMAWGQEIDNVELDHLGEMNHHELRPRDEEATALKVYADIYDTLFREGL
jgi:triacylglycerol lipase